MAKPYASELSRLEETFQWASATNIEQLKIAVKTAALSSLAAIGSGGSLTAAHALASLHQFYTGKVGLVQTPLEPLGGPSTAAHEEQTAANHRQPKLQLA